MIDVRATIRNLLSQNLAPNAVASGSAIGIFFGFLPFFGVKTLLSYFTSLALRVNTTAAIIAVTLHDVLLPFLPIILRVEYQIGYWLLHTPHEFAPRMKMKNIALSIVPNWQYLKRIGGPLLLGSVLFGLVAAALTYAVTYAFFRQRQLLKAAHAAKIAGEMEGKTPSIGGIDD